jgi:hypothetical protein
VPISVLAREADGALEGIEPSADGIAIRQPIGISAKKGRRIELCGEAVIDVAMGDDARFDIARAARGAQEATRIGVMSAIVDETGIDQE